MKTFLIRLTIFGVAILILATIIDLMVSQGLRHTPKNHLETMNIVMHDKPQNDVLILGTSRGANAYDTHILDSILDCNSRNLSVSGKAFRINNLRYQAYRRNNSAPKLIIVDIDHIELGEGTLGFENYMFYPYMMDTLVKPILKMNHFNWLDCHIPMYRYRGDYKYISLGLCELFNIYHLKGRGQKGFTPNQNGTFAGEKLRNEIKNHPNGIDVGCDSAVIDIFSSFLAQTKAENVQVVMVYSPLYYLVQNNLSTKWSTLMHIYDSLGIQYDVPILNYQKFDMNKDSIYFNDGNHLNLRGAEFFTTQLARDIDSLHLYSKSDK